MKSISLTFLIILLLTTSNFAQVAESATDICPLLISEKVPEIEITSLSNEKTLFTDILNQKPSVVLFYRGGWCGYCNTHLSAVQEVESEIIKMGFQLIAISPDSPEKLSESIDEHDFKYQLYSDSDLSLIKAMGLAFRAPDKYQSMLGKYSNNENSGIIPVPAMFVIATDGTILFEYINPDYSQRISANMIINVLTELQLERQ